MKQLKPISKQKGFTLLEAALAAMVMVSITMMFFQNQANEIDQDKLDLQAKRVAEITNAVIRYQSSAGDPDSGLLSPHEQSGVDGEPFQNETIHLGLSWLKPQSCGGTAPVEYLPCDYSEVIIIGDNTTYRFAVSNDGTELITTFQLVDSANHAQGIVNDGNIDIVEAAQLAGKAEGMVTFSSSGAVNSFFTSDKTTGIVQIEIGLNVANLPYQRRDGSSTITGTEHFSNSAGITFDTAGDIEGAATISANRYAAYDRDTQTVSETRYLELDGSSVLENVEVAGDLTAENAAVDSLQVTYLEQIDETLQSQFAGEVKIGNDTNNTIIGNGNIYTTGNIYDSNDTQYMLDLDSTSRVHDIALGVLNEALLSERLPNLVLHGTSIVEANSVVPKPECGTNGVARLIINPVQWTTAFLDNGNININNNLNKFHADEVGSDWIVRIQTYRVSDVELIDDENGSGIANIYCYYA